MTNLWIFGAFVFGLGIGSLLQGYNWASNAKGIVRKEWMGKLYKVMRDEEAEKLGYWRLP